MKKTRMIVVMGVALLVALGARRMLLCERRAGAVGIIGGADGPTVVYTTGKHTPKAVAAIALAVVPPLARLGQVLKGIK